MQTEKGRARACRQVQPVKAYVGFGLAMRYFGEKLLLAVAVFRMGGFYRFAFYFMTRAAPCFTHMTAMAS